VGDNYGLPSYKTWTCLAWLASKLPITLSSQYCLCSHFTKMLTGNPLQKAAVQGPQIFNKSLKVIQMKNHEKLHLKNDHSTTTK
jgi:hypothetical protein